jgi:hypothetical protein
MAIMNTVLTQPSTIHEAVNSREKLSGAVDPLAIATGSVGDSQSVDAPPSGVKSSAPIADLGLTIPQRGGPMDIKMTSATVGASINQVLLSPSGVIHRDSHHFLGRHRCGL